MGLCECKILYFSRESESQTVYVTGLIFSFIILEYNKNIIVCGTCAVTFPVEDHHSPSNLSPLATESQIQPKQIQVIGQKDI